MNQNRYIQLGKKKKQSKIDELKNQIKVLEARLLETRDATIARLEDEIAVLEDKLIDKELSDYKKSFNIYRSALYDSSSLALSNTSISLDESIVSDVGLNPRIGIRR